MLATLTAALLLQPAPAQATESVDVLVKTKDGAVSSAAADGTGGHVVSEVASDTALVRIAATSAQQAVRTLEARSDVEWAEPNYDYHAAFVPNDPCYSRTCDGNDQWYLDKLGVPAAWDVTTGARSVKIAILDSGVDTGHPDFGGRVVVGPNFSGDSTSVDEFGHGTHVAGTIGATTNNGIGIAGMAWTTSMVSVKVLDKDGSGTAATISQGLRWAADNGVRIANLSLGGGAYSQAMADAVAYAEARGVLVIAAADNRASTTKSYPAALPGVIAVGATDEDGKLASYSNRGPWVDLLAPGTNIVSTWPRSLSNSAPYLSDSGTSMAAAISTGVASLVWSAHPYLSASAVGERLVDTTNGVSGLGVVAEHGSLNAGSAVSDDVGGYRLIASDGGVFSYGVDFLGSTGGITLNKPIVTSASPGDGEGYWLIASDGGVFSFGEAPFYGSTGGTGLSKPIVGAAGTASGHGYWLVASDGGVFSFGDAQFYGSTGGMPLSKPIVGIIPTATGRGYWLVASDGGVFSFGDATFLGSTGGMALNAPIVGGARTPSGNGYWLVASDGGLFSFGDAKFFGSTGGMALNKAIVGMSPTATGEGYWLVASDGGVFSFGDGPFLGSTGGTALNKPIVAVLSGPR